MFGAVVVFKLLAPGLRFVCCSAILLPALGNRRGDPFIQSLRSSSFFAIAVSTGNHPASELRSAVVTRAMMGLIMQLSAPSILALTRS